MKLQFRLAHVLKRNDHIEPDGPEAKERAEFLVKTLSFINRLKGIVISLQTKCNHRFSLLEMLVLHLTLLGGDLIFKILGNKL